MPCRSSSANMSAGTAGEKQEPLVFAATVAMEEVHLALLLHAFRHHAQAELPGHGDGGAA